MPKSVVPINGLSGNNRDVRVLQRFDPGYDLCGDAAWVQWVSVMLARCSIELSLDEKARERKAASFFNDG